MSRNPKRQPTFTTERLKVRPFRTSDVGVMHALYGDAHNVRFRSIAPTRTREESRRQLREHLGYRPNRFAVWAIERRDQRGVVGMINYHRRELRQKRVDVGWLALPTAQGQGYMTEAMRALLRHVIDDLGVHKVEAQIMKANKPSVALARRLGFRLEGGPIRDRWLIDGEWRSTMLYGLIAGEER